MTIGCRHEALLYDADDDFDAAALPFLHAGLAAGDDVVLVCTERTNARVVRALGDAPQVTVLPRAEVYRTSAGAVTVMVDLVRRAVAHGAHRVRLIGEVDFGDSPDLWDEWSRYESVFNEALAPYPVWAICGYDTRRLPLPVLATAQLTHPHLRSGAGSQDSPRYLPTDEFLRRTADPGPDPAEFDAPLLTVAACTNVGELREALYSMFALVGPGPGVLDGFVFAVSEVATNAIVHGLPPVTVRVWSSPIRTLCTVTDHGPGFDDPLAGYLPVTEECLDAPMGLRIARQLCHHLSMSRAGVGFTVRLVAYH